MSELETYYKLIEDGKKEGISIHYSLDSTLWVRYQILVSELVKLPKPPRRCRKRLITAHAYYSDYRNLK